MSALNFPESESLHVYHIPKLANPAFDILMHIFAFYALQSKVKIMDQRLTQVSFEQT